jgi:hypothetical protein
LNTPGEKTTAARGMETEEQGNKVMELLGLVVRPHQKYLRDNYCKARGKRGSIQNTVTAINLNVQARWHGE